ncbi:MAG: type II toxin-antitoxin system HigB family toxin [Legionellaceae bacterium]|nr:type II toxin-antitoxin system HigB family toxin [Legionellaceae bacterium]
MHIISKKIIKEAIDKFPDCASALKGWSKIAEHSIFTCFDDLRKTFNSVDIVDDKFVFDIGGNKLRLIASIHFNRKKIYIRHILTHKEYYKNKWRS